MESKEFMEFKESKEFMESKTFVGLYPFYFCKCL